MHIDKIMVVGMSIFVFYTILFFLLWNFGLIYSDDDKKNISNWFTLFLELGVGLPIAIFASIKISTHYFNKSRQKELELFNKSRQQELKLFTIENTERKMEYIQPKLFMYHCFNNIDNTIYHYLRQFENDKVWSNIHQTITLPFQPNRFIDKFEAEIKKLRIIPINQAHKACEHLETLIHGLQQGSYTGNFGWELPFWACVDISQSLRLLKNEMEIKSDTWRGENSQKIIERMIKDLTSNT